MVIWFAFAVKNKTIEEEENQMKGNGVMKLSGLHILPTIWTLCYYFLLLFIIFRNYKIISYHIININSSCIGHVCKKCTYEREYIPRLYTVIFCWLFFIFFAFFSVVSFIRVCCLFSFYNCCCFFDIITTSPCLVSRITTDDDDDDDDGVCVRLHKMNKMRNKQRKTVQSDLTPMMVLYVILAAHMSSRLWMYIFVNVMDSERVVVVIFIYSIHSHFSSHFHKTYYV